MSKRFSILVLAALVVLLMSPLAAWAQVNSGYTVNSGIANTPHDFTKTYVSTTTPGACTTCHTPHKAQSTALLWNHKNATGPWSWTDTTTTTLGTPLPSITASWNGPTPKCLSCHDGTVAVGDVSWFDGKAQNLGITDATELPAGKITNSVFLVGNPGGAGSLNNNHPVAVPFPVGQAPNTYNSKQSGNGATGIWGDYVTDPTVNKIILYQDTAGSITRIASSATGTNNGIECSSCHDPHNRAGADSDKYFLRGKLTGNTTTYICLKCHVK